MVRKNFLADAYVDGLNQEQIHFMKAYNLKEISERTNISYRLLRNAVNAKRIPRSIYNEIAEFIKNHGGKK